MQFANTHKASKFSLSTLHFIYFHCILFSFLLCIYLNFNYSNSNQPLVHHMTLFECTTKSYPGSDPHSWEVWVKSSGAVCNSNLLTPHDWDSCITPVAVWSIGSTGIYMHIHLHIFLYVLYIQKRLYNQQHACKLIYMPMLRIF